MNIRLCSNLHSNVESPLRFTPKRSNSAYYFCDACGREETRALANRSRDTVSLYAILTTSKDRLSSDPTLHPLGLQFSRNISSGALPRTPLGLLPQSSAPDPAGLPPCTQGRYPPMGRPGPPLAGGVIACLGGRGAAFKNITLPPCTQKRRTRSLEIKQGIVFLVSRGRPRASQSDMSRQAGPTDREIKSQRPWSPRSGHPRPERSSLFSSPQPHPGPVTRPRRIFGPRHASTCQRLY